MSSSTPSVSQLEPLVKRLQTIDTQLTGRTGTAAGSTLNDLVTSLEAIASSLGSLHDLQSVLLRIEAADAKIRQQTISTEYPHTMTEVLQRLEIVGPALAQIPAEYQHTPAPTKPTPTPTPTSTPAPTSTPVSTPAPVSVKPASPAEPTPAPAAAPEPVKADGQKSSTPTPTPTTAPAKAPSTSPTPTPATKPASTPAAAPATAAAAKPATSAPVAVVVPATSSSSSSSSSTGPYYSHDQLKTSLPTGVDPKNKELHLEDHVFETLFKMTKEAWGKVAGWKKEIEKKKHGLF